MRVEIEQNQAVHVFKVAEISGVPPNFDHPQLVLLNNWVEHHTHFIGLHEAIAMVKAKTYQFY